MNIKDIKNDFPVLGNSFEGKKVIYFDNACTVLKSKYVIEAVKYYYENLGVCGGNRSSYPMSWQVQELVEQSKNDVAKFINADSPKEIVWTKNATEGVNLIASSFVFSEERNEVLIVSYEHNSSFLPFYEQSKRRGFVLKTVAPLNNGKVDMKKFKRLISRKTALVIVTHLSNVTGLKAPVKEIAKICHDSGAKILVDDAQYVAIHKEDVLKNEIDFLVFSGHKIGGPTGIGVLYVRQNLFDKILPYLVGGGTVESVTNDENKTSVDYLPFAARYEAGIQNYAGIIGLSEAIKYLNKIRQENIPSWTRELSSYTYGKLKKYDEIKFLPSFREGNIGHLISFYFSPEKKLSLHDFNLFLGTELKDYFVAVRCGNHCSDPLHKFMNIPVTMRLSFFAYNTKEEIDIFIRALDKFLK